MKNTVIRFGLISGAIISALMAISMLSVKDNLSDKMGTSSMIIGYAGMLIGFIFIFLAIRQYRDRHAMGVIRFGKAFGMGLLIALIASAMYVVTWAVVYNYYMPHFMEEYTNMMAQKARASLSGVALDNELAALQKGKEMYNTPAGFIFFTFAEIFPVGLLVSLIAALVMRRNVATAKAV